MSNKKSALKNIIHVAFSRGVSLLSGVAVGLLIPKILSVEGYGYFKIYTLYITYTALLHFGFVDGILLRLAGKDYEKLDKSKVRTYTVFFVSFQIAIGAAMAISSIFLQDSDYSFILLMLGINMIIINITSYYQFVSQATQRFAEYSARNFMVAVLKIAFVLVLLVAQMTNFFDVSYKIYVIGLNFIDGFLLLWYIFTYRDITFGQRTLLSESKKDIISIFKQGIILTAAYQVSHLVLSLDRQFVSILYSTEEYAIYSFAYNIVTLISTMISSLSVVLLPMLKKATEEFVKNNYKNVMAVVSILVGISIACYFPLDAFIKWFLPYYEYSTVYIRIVLPSLMYSSCISVVMFTFCKVLDMNFKFFKNGCIVLVIGFVSNVIAYMIFKTPESISYASLVTMALWFLIEGHHLGKAVNVKTYKEFIYISLLSAGFILTTTVIPSICTGMIVYVLFYVAVTFAMYRSFIKSFLQDRLKKR